MIVLVVAVVALRDPKQAGTSAGSATGTSSSLSQTSGAPVRSGTSRSVSSPSRSSSHSPSTRPRTSGAPARSTPGSTSASTSSGATSGSTSSTGKSAVGSFPLVVLNQGLLDGTAGAAARRFEAVGWSVTSTNEDYVNNVITPTAYYDPSVRGAQAAARALAGQFPTIDRVAERFSNLPAGPIVVVLTRGYSPN